MSTKYCNPAAIDLALGYIAQADKQYACSQYPTSYADVLTYSLASVDLAAGAFSITDGVVSGRRLTIAEHKGVSVLVNGQANFVVLVHTASDQLLYVTTSDPQGLTTGSYVDFPEWSIEIENPS